MEVTTDISSSYPYKFINSVSEYMQYVETAAQQLKSDMVRDEYLAFRGQSDASYPLAPSIARPLKYRPDIQMMHFEKELVYTAQHEHPAEFLKIHSPIELLIKLQHFGIPTRLLDITTNALVALYFACNGNSEKDAEVFVLKLRRDYHWNDPMAEFIADTYRLDMAEKSIRECYETFKKQPYYVEPLISDGEDEENLFYDFRNNLDLCHKEPLVVQPPKTFLRLNAQSGQFLLFTNDLCYDGAADIPVEMDGAIGALNKTHKFIQGVIRIPHSSKAGILRDLSVLGISRSTLFHDNIGIVCEEIVKAMQNRGIEKRLNN